MRVIIALLTVLSACWCLSVLNIFSCVTTGEKYDQFSLEKRTFLNNPPTYEEILRCKNFTDKIVLDLNQEPIEEELQDILFQCSLILQQNSILLANRDVNDSAQWALFEHYRRQRREFDAENLIVETYEEVKNKNTGTSVNSALVPITEQNEGSLTEKLTDRPENNKTDNNTVILNSTNTNWSLWNYLYGHSGSSDTSSLDQAADQNEGTSTEKLHDNPINPKAEFNTVILDSQNTSWSLWNYLLGARGSISPSNQNLERGPITESSNYLEKSTEFQYSANEVDVRRWNIIMPGTKWCGAGDIAENDDDLGYFEDVDRCCRAHDKCSDIMKSKQSKYNLTNTSPFTVLNCKCDDELHECLNKIDSFTSNTVGNTYFNILSRMCYTLDYPRKCTKYSLLGCVEYVLDKTAEKVYQWKSAKKYLKKPFTISG